MKSVHENFFGKYKYIAELDTYTGFGIKRNAESSTSVGVMYRSVHSTFKMAPLRSCFL